MKNVHSLALLVPLIVAGCGGPAPVQTGSNATTKVATSQPAINWVPYSDDVFAQAKKDHKLVILDLHAVWCHWCHVMDKTTYADPEVQKVINENFLAIGVDQDSRPDISNKYGDYGWPATVFYDSNGKVIVIKQGYQEPQRMISLLKAIIADPSPVGNFGDEPAEVHAATNASLGPASSDRLKKALVDFYDEKQGAWGKMESSQKFVDANLIEYSTIQAQKGDKDAEHRVRQTLTAALAIIDPAWGGVYQYSTDDDWVHPHFEKIMSYQTDDMRTYARSYAIWQDPQYLGAARAIHHFLTTFLLSPQGAFYTSMDADLIDGQHGGEYFALDDAGRRKLGIPRIDTHIYSRENGWAISSLVALSEYAGDPKALDEARTAANWIIANRSLVGGGFSHDEKDVAGPYLGDTLAMGRAFLDLYAATGDRDWLDKANAAAKYIEANFVSTDPRSAGVVTSIVQPGSAIQIVPETEENVNVVRFARLLYAYTGVNDHQALAERAMKYLAAPQVVDRLRLNAGPLLADAEMSVEPPHITILGSKADPKARELYTQVANWPVTYKRTEWYDVKEGPLMHMDVEYPPMDHSVAFVCANGACSSPMTDVAKLQAKLASLAKK